MQPRRISGDFPEPGSHQPFSASSPPFWRLSSSQIATKYQRVSIKYIQLHPEEYSIISSKSPFIYSTSSTCIMPARYPRICNDHIHYAQLTKRWELQDPKIEAYKPHKARYWGHIPFRSPYIGLIINGSLKPSTQSFSLNPTLFIISCIEVFHLVNYCNLS